MKTSSMKLLIPAALSPTIKTLEVSVQGLLDEIAERKRAGTLAPEAEAKAKEATQALQAAASQFAPVVAAWAHRAKMASLPRKEALRELFESDIKDEIAASEVLVAASFRRMSEAEKADLDRETLEVANRLALRREALDELKESIARREEMVSNSITVAHQTEIVEFAGALRTCQRALQHALNPTAHAPASA